MANEREIWSSQLNYLAVLAGNEKEGHEVERGLILLRLPILQDENNMG